MHTHKHTHSTVLHPSLPLHSSCKLWVTTINTQTQRFRHSCSFVFPSAFPSHVSRAKGRRQHLWSYLPTRVRVISLRSAHWQLLDGHERPWELTSLRITPLKAINYCGREDQTGRLLKYFDVSLSVTSHQLYFKLYLCFLSHLQLYQSLPLFRKVFIYFTARAPRGGISDLEAQANRQTGIRPPSCLIFTLYLS